MLTTVLRPLRNQNGATSIEYAMIAAGIAVAIVAAVLGLGTAVKANYSAVLTSMK